MRLLWGALAAFALLTTTAQGAPLSAPIELGPANTTLRAFAESAGGDALSIAGQSCGDGLVAKVRRGPSGTWTTTAPPFPGTVCVQAAAFDPGGTAHVLAITGNDLTEVTLPPGGTTWTSPQVVAPRPDRVYGLAYAGADALLIEGTGGLPRHARLRRRAAGSGPGFADPEALANNVDLLEYATTPQGAFAVLVTQDDGTIVTRTGRAGQALDPAVVHQAGTGQRSYNGLGVALAPTGRLAITVVGGPGPRVFVREAGAGAFSPPQVLGFYPQSLAMSPDGHLLVAGKAYDGDDDVAAVQSAAPGASIGAVTALGPTDILADEFRAIPYGASGFRVVWRERVGNEDRRLKVAVRRGTDPFCRPIQDDQTISSDFLSDLTVSGATDRLTVVVGRSIPSAQRVLAYEADTASLPCEPLNAPAPPEPVLELAGTTVPSTLALGQRGTFSATTTGGVSADFTWDFGEGAAPQTTTGRPASTVEHTYTTLGTKTVTLRVSAAGRAPITRTFTVVVTAARALTRPTISGLRVVGRRVTFAVSEDVRLSAQVRRRFAGRRIGGRCRIGARRGRRCTATRRFRFRTRAVRAGSGRLTLPRGLNRGIWTIEVVATDPDGLQARRALRFRVRR